LIPGIVTAQVVVDTPEVELVVVVQLDSAHAGDTIKAANNDDDNTASHRQRRLASNITRDISR
jgi:hypothetical protein